MHVFLIKSESSKTFSLPGAKVPYKELGMLNEVQIFELQIISSNSEL